MVNLIIFMNNKIILRYLTIINNTLIFLLVKDILALQILRQQQSNLIFSVIFLINQIKPIC